MNTTPNTTELLYSAKNPDSHTIHTTIQPSPLFQSKPQRTFRVVLKLVVIFLGVSMFSIMLNNVLNHGYVGRPQTNKLHDKDTKWTLASWIFQTVLEGLLDSYCFGILYRKTGIKVIVEDQNQTNH